MALRGKARILQLIKKVGYKPFTATQLRLESKIRGGKDLDYSTILKVLEELLRKRILRKTPKFFQYELVGDLKC